MSGPAYRPAPAVAHVVGTEFVYVASLPNGPILVLEGSAAVIWSIAVESPSEDLAALVAERWGAEPDEIRDDVQAFVADLVERGLLERNA